METDWRAYISDIDNLYDVDPFELIIFLRHQYLDVAKDMLRTDDWDGMGESAAEVAESLQKSLEHHCGFVDLPNEIG